MPKPAETVRQFMDRLEHPLKAEIDALRAIVQNANPQITEHIKWNAPSFCYGGEDRVTFKLHPTDRIQLIFHRGAKAKADDGFVFADTSGLIQWVTSDRGTVTFRDMPSIQAQQATLTQLVDQWVKATVQNDE